MPKLLLSITTILLSCCLISNRCKAQDYCSPNLYFDSPENLLSQYVQIPSISGNEYEAGDFLKRLFLCNGFHVRVFSEEHYAYNLAASIYPLNSGKPNIVLLSHMDVVPPTIGVPGKFSAFDGTIADGCVWGRGAIDNKGMLTMQYFAALNYLDISKEKELPFNITLLAVSGKETDSEMGAKYVSDNFINELNPVVVFGEGGAGIDSVVQSKPHQKVFGIELAAKRILWLKLSYAAKQTGHSSVPPNAYPMKDFIRILNNYSDYSKNQKPQFSAISKKMFIELGKLEGGIKGFILRNISFFHPFIKKQLLKDENAHVITSNTITITNFNTTNYAVNSHPTEIQAILDCRLLPETNTDTFLADLRKYIHSEDIILSVITEGAKAPATKEDKFYQFTQQAIEKIYPDAIVSQFLFPASDDNNTFRKHKIPVLGILPIYLTKQQYKSIHGVDEHISIKELHKGIRVYKEILKSIENSFTTSNSKMKY